MAYMVTRAPNNLGKHRGWGRDRSSILSVLGVSYAKTRSQVGICATSAFHQQSIKAPTYHAIDSLHERWALGLLSSCSALQSIDSEPQHAACRARVTSSSSATINGLCSDSSSSAIDYTMEPRAWFQSHESLTAAVLCQIASGAAVRINEIDLDPEFPSQIYRYSRVNNLQICKIGLLKCTYVRTY